MTKQSKSFGATRAFRQHILAGHGVGAEIRDLRSDVEEGFQNNEARASFPHLDWLDDGTTLKAAGGDVKILGRNLLQGQTFDVLSFGLTTAKVDLAVLKPGASGFSAEIVQGTGALAAAFAGGVLTITLAAAGSTSNAVAAAVNAEPTCVGIILATGHGVGTVLVAAETEFAGGEGLYAGNQILVSGSEALPKHAAGLWTEDTITVTVPALTGLTPARAAGDIVNIVVSSDGIHSEPLSGVLA